MKYQPSTSPGQSSNKERGSVLLICLILLIAVTLLGVSSMNMTTVEHKIISNTRNQTLALSGAETALSEAADIVQAQSGPQKRTGIQLFDVQNNDTISDRTDLNKLVNTITVTLNTNQTINIPLWGQGAVTDNSSYLGSSSRQSWWANTDNTTSLSMDLLADNSKLTENNYQLATNPRYVIEKGEFIPDDLSPGALAEYRGRQAFTTIARSTGSTQMVESTLQSTVVTRFR